MNLDLLRLYLGPIITYISREICLWGQAVFVKSTNCLLTASEVQKMENMPYPLALFTNFEEKTYMDGR